MRQDAIKVEQAGSPGNFEVANWGQAQLDGLRDAILTMAPQVTDGKGMFCKKDAVDAVRQHVHRDHRNRAAEPESIVRLQELCQTLGLSADAEEFPLELADVPSGPDGLAGPSGWRAAVGDHSAPIEKLIAVTRFSWWTGIRPAATISVEDVSRHGPGSGPGGQVMNRKVDQRFADWWSRRDAAEDRASTSPIGAPNSVARALLGETRDSWDPGDVWLRRIDQPRRRSRRA